MGGYDVGESTETIECTENHTKSLKYAKSHEILQNIGGKPIIKHTIFAIFMRKQQKSPGITKNNQKSLKFREIK